MSNDEPSSATPAGASRWTDRDDVLRGDRYDERFAALAATGHDVHGEAALVQHVAEGTRVLDAGCGTGRVAIELAHRGYDVVGTDIDPAMLEAARQKAPSLRWEQGDLVDLDLDLDAEFDVVIAAGNVLIFVAPGTEAAVLERCARHVRPGGSFITGFSVQPGGYDPQALDRDATAAGLELDARWSTWDRQPWSPGGDYQVSVHRRPVA